MILGSKNKPTDYHDKIDYERVNKLFNNRVALSTQDHQQTNMWTSIGCSEDLRNILLTDGL